MTPGMGRHVHPPFFVDAIDDTAGEAFFSPSDNFGARSRLGRTFHLSLEGDFTRVPDVDGFLEEMDWKELLGYNEPIDTAAYAVKSVRASMEDAVKLQPYLGWRPLEVVQRTLENTTQLAHQLISTPMKDHIMGLYKFLNRPRLDEVVATNTFFSSARNVTGATCAQVFYGLSSHFVNVYGMASEQNRPDCLDDFLRKEGAPNDIRSDNLNMERWQTRWLQQIRDLFVSSEFTEPHHPQ